MFDENKETSQEEMSKKDLTSPQPSLSEDETNKPDVASLDVDSMNKKEDNISAADKIISKGVAIHSMPEKFRQGGAHTSSAKSTGLIILVGGFLFLVILLFLAYFYFVRDTGAPADNALQNEIVGQEKEKIDSVLDTKKDIPEKDDKLEVKDDIATTTDVFLEDDVATTSEEIIIPSTDVQVIDSDGDGLSDKEEDILGSQLNNIDSDGDGYDDLSELLNMYNPAGEGKITDNINIKEYVNNTFGYNLIYPAAWTFREIGGDDSIFFTSGDDQFIQVISQPNDDNLSIEDWYKDRFKVSSISSLKKISQGNWQGIKSDDELIIYITDLNYNNIITVTYNPGLSDSYDYKNIFDMVVNSFEIK